MIVSLQVAVVALELTQVARSSLGISAPSMPVSGFDPCHRCTHPSEMPVGWEAVTETVIFFLAVVPSTMSLPPLTTTFLITGSVTTVRADARGAAAGSAPNTSAAVGASGSATPLPSAWAAGRASAERARAPETTATVARIRMCSPDGEGARGTWFGRPGPSGR